MIWALKKVLFAVVGGENGDEFNYKESAVKKCQPRFP